MEGLQEKGVAVGIDLGGSSFRAAIVDENGNIYQRRWQRVGPWLEGLELVSLIHGEATLLSELARREGARVLGVGVGVPGAINLKEGVISSSANFPKWKSLSLGSLLRARLPFPVEVENDANAFVIGEGKYGAARGLESFLGVTLGTGVGGGIFLEGRIWHGVRGMAGELGHITVEPDGERCTCGNYGCLELYSSATALVRLAGRGIAEGKETSLTLGDLDPQIISAAAAGGDPLALMLFECLGRFLGIGISTVFNLLNIEVAVVGGGLSGAWEQFQPALCKEVEARAAYTLPGSSPVIMRAALGDTGAILGAATLVFDQVSRSTH